MDKEKSVSVFSKRMDNTSYKLILGGSDIVSAFVHLFGERLSNVVPYS